MSRSVSVVSAAAGRDTSFAIDATGTLYSWGGGGRRALGRGLPLLPRTRIKLKTVSMENVLIAKTRAYVDLFSWSYYDVVVVVVGGVCIAGHTPMSYHQTGTRAV